MCVIAGYIGPQQAAPVLLEMLQRQEGLWGGFYSGIVTIHEGRLHHAKVVGDAATLMRETQALSLPGTIGLAHGRTPGGGGQAWAHPFLDRTEQLAYIANGGPGLFAAERSRLARASEALCAAGHVFTSRQQEPVGSEEKYPRLPTGESVHVSDLMCQAIAQALVELKEAKDPLLAAAIRTYEEFPAEIAGLILHADRPNEIIAMRINKPMILGRSGVGDLFIASSPAGLMEEATWRMRMPFLTGGVFHRDGSVTLQPMSRLQVPFAERPAGGTTEALIAQQLDLHGEVHAPQLMTEAKRSWPAGVLGQREVLIYQILRDWEAEGWIVAENRPEPGVENQGTVLRTWFRWRDANRRPRWQSFPPPAV